MRHKNYEEGNQGEMYKFYYKIFKFIRPEEENKIKGHWGATPGKFLFKTEN